MSFYINRDKNWYLGDTGIENIFINEYMVDAPGEYVKAYIYARMHAEIGSEITNSMISMELAMEDEDVLKAWSYWESKGVIRKRYKSPDDRYNYDVEFLSLKEGQMVKPEAEVPESHEKSELEDEDIQGLFMAIERQIGRPLSYDEMSSAADWMAEMGADPEVILCAFKVAQERNVVTSRYVGAIIRNWMDEGLRNAEDVENYLNDTSERRYLYRRVFKALGFDRNWTEKEKRIMDRWFDDYGFSIDRVIEACDRSSGISNPNLNYVNKILSNWHEENERAKNTPEAASGKKISSSQVLKYYEILRDREEKEAEERRKEVYREVPEIKALDDELKSLNVEMTKSMFVPSGADRSEKLEELKQRMEDISVEKAFLLTDNNFRPDYMDVKYQCDICQDTGVTPEGIRCECFNMRAEEAIEWEKNQK